MSYFEVIESDVFPINSKLKLIDHNTLSIHLNSGDYDIYPIVEWIEVNDGCISVRVLFNGYTCNISKIKEVSLIKQETEEIYAVASKNSFIPVDAILKRISFNEFQIIQMPYLSTSLDKEKIGLIYKINEFYKNFDYTEISINKNKLRLVKIEYNLFNKKNNKEKYKFISENRILFRDMYKKNIYKLGFDKSTDTLFLDGQFDVDIYTLGEAVDLKNLIYYADEHCFIADDKDGFELSLYIFKLSDLNKEDFFKLLNKPNRS